MELKEVLLKRRSVRKFTDEPVSEQMIEELLHAAMSGPSACNRKPWDFYVVTNEEKLEELKSASKFTKFSAKLKKLFGNAETVDINTLALTHLKFVLFALIPRHTSN